MGIMRNWRIRSLFKRGWRNAGEIVRYPDVQKSRLSVFLDILSCFRRYYVFSNQYKLQKIWTLSNEERDTLCNSIGKANRERDEWYDDYYENRRFLNKYTSRKYETSPKLIRERRCAYTKRYHLGKNCTIQFNVEFSREHRLNGTLTVGNNVVFAKNVFIDYTGEVVIEDGVKMANGVIVESHHRDIDANNEGMDVNVPTKILIREKAYIGSRAIILDSCNYIGKHARIGAGAVVTKDIPDYAVAVGVPAKVIKILPHEEE